MRRCSVRSFDWFYRYLLSVLNTHPHTHSMRYCSLSSPNSTLERGAILDHNYTFSYSTSWARVQRRHAPYLHRYPFYCQTGKNILRIQCMGNSHYRRQHYITYHGYKYSLLSVAEFIRQSGDYYLFPPSEIFISGGQDSERVKTKQ